MKAPVPPTPRKRGIGGVKKPAGGNLKSSGIGDLKSPRVAGQAPQKGAVPSADEPMIAAMQKAAREGVQSGATGDERDPATQPGSQPGNIPRRDSIVAPAGFQVP